MVLRGLHYILFYEFVDNFVEKRTPFRQAHREHVHQAYRLGEIVLAGALTEPIDGGVLVFKGESAGAAEKFANSDPYVLNGLVKSWKVRKWMTIVGEGSNPPS